MNRREWLKTAALAGGAAMAGGRIPALDAKAAVLPQPRAAPAGAPAAAGKDLWKKLPRWRGFNLLEKFMVHSNKQFVETDFEWIHEWGFDFVRLPMDYRCWTDKDDPYKFDERVLKEIDQAVEFGRKHKVHVNLCLHRAPGYTVAQPPEKLNLWQDEEAQKQFDTQWAMLARRYKGLPSTEVSIDLVNEPDNRVTPEAYAKVVRRVAAAIRKEDADRLIIADGRSWGREPVFELVDDRIAQSTRGYEPFHLTHYKASWVGGGNWAEPTWPLQEGQKPFDRARLQQTCIAPWQKLEARGVGIHVGEWGAFNKTPHAVVLAWMRDCLALWREAGWGWAMWNFRGAFGVLDSGRADVQYEDFRGRKLDRQMLDLVREM
jgi:endoglucanase